MNSLPGNIIGIGDLAVISDVQVTLKTFALGSCVAVIAYDFRRKIGGMLHLALPDSSINPEKAAEMPGYFADTGVKALLERMIDLGSKTSSMQIRLAGGANVMDKDYSFDIGKRNILAARKILWKYSLGAVAEDTGGNISRTVSLNISDGRVCINSGNRKWEL